MVEVRITRAGWRRIGPAYAGDRRVLLRGRSDWCELHLTADDLDAVKNLLTEAVHANLT